MKLDPCPWCGDMPKVEFWITSERTYPSFTDCEMVRISCCHANLVCQKEDAEINWNWK